MTLACHVPTLSSGGGCVRIYACSRSFKHLNSTVAFIRSPQFLLGHVGVRKFISAHLSMSFSDTVWVKYVLLKGGRLHVCPRLALLASYVQTIHVQFRKLCTETLSSVGCVGMYTYNYLFQHYSTVNNFCWVMLVTVRWVQHILTCSFWTQNE